MIDSNLPTVTAPSGRGAAYSDKVRKAILTNLKIGCTRVAAYGAAGISESTFFRWMGEDGSFREAVLSAESEAERTYTGRLARQAAKGDTAAIKFWLERRRRANWRESVSVDEGPLPLDEQIDEALENDDVDRRLQALAGDALRRRASSSGGHPEDGAGPESGAEQPDVS